MTSPQISYGSSSSIFSENAKFPSFLRTVHSNKEVMLAIVKLLQYFEWHWVAFLYTSDDYGSDGQKMFMERIKNTEICLAYTNDLGNSDLWPILQQINAQKINVIVVFAPEWTAKRLIQSAIRHNVTDKVWIAAEAWALNKELPKEKGIKKIGTVIGVSQLSVSIPGFDHFIYSAKKQNRCESAEQQFCNQVCNCSKESAEDILAADPSFTFPVYSAVYAAAHALHNVLNCGSGRCDNGISISPPAVRVSEARPRHALPANKREQTVEIDTNFLADDASLAAFSRVEEVQLHTLKRESPLQRERRPQIWLLRGDLLEPVRGRGEVRLLQLLPLRPILHQ